MTDPATTHRIFQHDRVAEGYASARPYLHPQVLSRVRDAVGQTDFRRALDVGCGTGMSSVALLQLARAVVGVDASTEMLGRARRQRGVTYAAAAAEALPFGDRSFDLILACGSMDWVDRTVFVPRAAQLLEREGWLVALDFGDTGRSPDLPALEEWYTGSFQRRYPRPVSADPIITAGEASSSGFDAPMELDFVLACSFTAVEYARFLMTESTVVGAVEYGIHTARDVFEWLQGELGPLIGSTRLRVLFGGYIQAIRRH